MHKVALIYNPASGQHSARRKAAIQSAIDVLHEAGVTAEAFTTSHAGSATEQAKCAIDAGFDTIVACGGDGTVHEVLQSVVGTSVALGVVPLGTANALAADLGVNGSPAKAMSTLLKANPTSVSVGRIHYRETGGGANSRYFTVAAGVGADALLMSRLDARLKRRLGYLLYMVEAARILFTHGFPLFEAVVPANGNGHSRVLDVSQLLAVRVHSFGGALQNLAPGASLRNGSLTLLAFKTRSRLRYVLFMLAVLARRHTFQREVELVETQSIECRPRNGSQEELFVEADGEVLGLLPVKLEVVPHSLMLLVPNGVQP
jgi:lipid kinase, YegS/Rv2252/BmrU family